MPHEDSWQIDVEPLFALLSTHLYPHRLAFFRELVTNAVDAIALRSGAEGRVVVRRAGATLEVSDDGRGLAPEDVGTTLGCVGVSGTQALRARLVGETQHLPAPSGTFGIGLLSCWGVAEEVTIRSWRGDGSPGIVWSWRGGARYVWDVDPAPAHRGTTVTLRLRDEWRDGFTTGELAAYARSELPFVAAEVIVGDERTSDRAPPWRVSAGSPVALLRWLDGRGVTAVAAASVPIPGRSGGGVVVALPSTRTRWIDQLHLYRSGVRVRQYQRASLLPAALDWLSVWVDAPDVQVALDRESLGELGVEQVRAALAATLPAALDLLLARAEAATPSDAWFAHHRARLVDTLAWRIDQVPATGDVALRQWARWVPFRTSVGHRTLAQLRDVRGGVFAVQRRLHDIRVDEHDHASGVVVEWEGEEDQRVFTRLAEHLGLLFVHWQRGETAALPEPAHAYPRFVAGFADALRKAAAAYRVLVQVDPGFREDGLAARWIRPPAAADAASPVFSLAELVPWGSLDDAIAQPTLGLNPWSPVVQHLARAATDGSHAALTMLLAEYATLTPRASGSAQLRELQRRLVEAMFTLGSGRPPPPRPIRCYVAYDWQRERREFAALVELLTRPPYEWEVIDASTHHHGEYFLGNILDAMTGAHVYISILQDHPAVGRLNYNVLMEAGIAASFRGRPHLVCQRGPLGGVSNIDGFLGVVFRDADDLARAVDDVARRRDLHRIGGGDAE